MGDTSQVLEKVKDAEALFVKISTKVNKELIDNASKLKYIGVCSTAFDSIDAQYARSKKITVCNLGGYSTEAVSEFAFAALLEHIRELERAKNQAKKEDFGFVNFMGKELANRTLGVIGAGKIGSKIAEIGLGFGMNVLYFSRENKPAIDNRGAQKKELDEVLSQSDFVALSLALNSETKGLISNQKISLLKKDCVFISIAPPHLIDEKAIMQAAKQGNLTFIFDHSDDTEFAKEFLETPNCVVYPPVAFRTEEANFNRWDTFAANVEKFVEGNPQNIVN